MNYEPKKLDVYPQGITSFLLVSVVIEVPEGAEVTNPQGIKDTLLFSIEEKTEVVNLNFESKGGDPSISTQITYKGCVWLTAQPLKETTSTIAKLHINGSTKSKSKTQAQYQVDPPFVGKIPKQS